MAIHSRALVVAAALILGGSPRYAAADLLNDFREKVVDPVVKPVEKAVTQGANAAGKAAGDAAQGAANAAQGAANAAGKLLPPVPDPSKPSTLLPIPQAVLPPQLRSEIDKLPGNVARSVEQAGQDTLTTLSTAAGDSVRSLQKAGGDTIVTVQKAGSDTVQTVSKAGSDATATYIKGWRDTADQSKRSFDDAVDAGKAGIRYTENQAKAQLDAARNAERRVRDGKVVDAMWGLAVEPLQASERNFAQATQESELINTAAGSAAAVYGGPAGAAAYAAWSTYRRTGDADLALRNGILAGLTSQMGSATASLPANTTGEIVKKAALAGAAGGLAVAAAGGDEQAIKEGFLKSGGAVLVQGGTAKLKAYSPKAADAYQTVQCISARDVDCIGNTTWAKDAKGKILYDANGKPRIDTTKLDPKQYIGKWSSVDPNSAQGKAAALVAQISKLPKRAGAPESIPLMNNEWVLTSTLGKAPNIGFHEPAVVLTYVGADPPFISTVSYGRAPVIVPGALAYACPFAGYERTVKVSKRASSCDAVYRKEGGVSQVVWASDHQSEICTAKAEAFVVYLGSLGIPCAAR